MAWSNISNGEGGLSTRNKLNELGTATDRFEAFGVYDYNDAATASTPINVTGGGGYVALTNDGAGAFTNKTYALTAVADVWLTGTNRFSFTNLELGDTIDIRIDVQVTTTSPNQLVELELLVAEGGSAYSLKWIEQSFKNSGVHSLIRWNSVYLGDVNTQTNPAYFRAQSDGNATVVVNGWYCRAMKRQPVKLA